LPRPTATHSSNCHARFFLPCHWHCFGTRSQIGRINATPNGFFNVGGCSRLTSYRNLFTCFDQLWHVFHLTVAQNSFHIRGCTPEAMRVYMYTWYVRTLYFCLQEQDAAAGPRYNVGFGYDDSILPGIMIKMILSFQQKGRTKQTSLEVMSHYRLPPFSLYLSCSRSLSFSLPSPPLCMFRRPQACQHQMDRNLCIRKHICSICPLTCNVCIYKKVATNNLWGNPSSAQDRRSSSVPRQVWHDSFICVKWLIHVWDMMQLHVWNDSFIHMWDMSYTYVRHDSFIRETWLIHLRDTNNSYVRHDSSIDWWLLLLLVTVI